MNIEQTKSCTERANAYNKLTGLQDILDDNCILSEIATKDCVKVELINYYNYFFKEPF